MEASANVKSGGRKMLYGVNMLKHVIKRGGKEGSELRVEDLDEKLLKSRLTRIQGELQEYRSKCQRYKHQNEWYRKEIEECQKDTVLLYAIKQLGRSEKRDSIDRLNEANRKHTEHFNQKKDAKQKENDAKIQELKDLIITLEDKIHIKQQDLMKLSDVMGKRARHDAEISKIRREIQNAEAEHLLKVEEIEKSLIESRYKIQKETDGKLKIMQSEAHDRATKYLEEHTLALDAENKKLEMELLALNAKTQEQLLRKQSLEKENADLEREECLRKDLIRIRLQRIQNAQIKADAEAQKSHAKKLKQRRLKMEKIISEKHLGFISDGLDPLDLQWSDEDFSDD